MYSLPLAVYSSSSPRNPSCFSLFTSSTTLRSDSLACAAVHLGGAFCCAFEAPKCALWVQPSELVHQPHNVALRQLALPCGANAISVVPKSVCVVGAAGQTQGLRRARQDSTGQAQAVVRRVGGGAGVAARERAVQGRLAGQRLGKAAAQHSSREQEQAATHRALFLLHGLQAAQQVLQGQVHPAARSAGPK